MATINENYNDDTKLKDWWPIVKQNFKNLNTESEENKDELETKVDKEDGKHLTSANIEKNPNAQTGDLLSTHLTIGTRKASCGTASLTVGNDVQASEANSAAFGYMSVAQGYASLAEGSAKAVGSYSHAEGVAAEASGEGSHAEGNQTKAQGDYSHAEGDQAIASAQGAHAEGFSSQASGQYSHAEGFASTASGNYAHSEGQQTIAGGNCSHAEGTGTSAGGASSHAEGSGTIAAGGGSHAEGTATTAQGENQHVQGKYNIPDETSAFIIGNGTTDQTRSNAMTVDWQGNAVFAGTVTGAEGKTLSQNDYTDEDKEALAGKADKQNGNYGFNGGKDATCASGGAIGYQAGCNNGGAVGEDAHANAGGAIGYSASATYGGAVGQNAEAVNGGAIGDGAVAGNGFSGGQNAKISGTGEDGIPIDAIQLGTGTNPNANTLQVYSYQLLDANGYIPSQRLQTPQGGFNGGDNSDVSQNTTTGGAIGKDTFGSTGFAGGESAKAMGGGGACGEGTLANMGFAGGLNAQCLGTMGLVDAIQLGTGTNPNAKTLQVYSYQMMDASGNVPKDRILQAVTAILQENGLIS